MNPSEAFDQKTGDHEPVPTEIKTDSIPPAEKLEYLGGRFADAQNEEEFTVPTDPKEPSPIVTETPEEETQRRAAEKEEIEKLRAALTGLPRGYQEEKRAEIIENAGLSSEGLRTDEEMRAEQELLAQDKNWMESLARDQDAARAENALRDLNAKIEVGGDPEAASVQQREQQEKLQNILSALEEQRMTKDQSLLERGIQSVIEGTERYRKLGWKSKVAVGLALGAAGIGAAVAAPVALGAVTGVGLAMRGVGARSLYMGVKERDVAKAEEERMARGTETGDYNEINKVIAENALNKKGLALAGIMALVMPAAFREAAHTDIGHSVLEYAADLGGKALNKTGEILGAGLGISSAHAGELPPEILASRSQGGFGTRGFTVSGETSQGNIQSANVGNIEGQPPSMDLGAQSAEVIRPGGRIAPVSGYRPTAVGESIPSSPVRPVGEVVSPGVKPVEGFRVRGLGGTPEVTTPTENTPGNFTPPEQNFDLTQGANLDARPGVVTQPEVIVTANPRVEHASVSPIAAVESVNLRELSGEAKQALAELFPQRTLLGGRVINQALWDRFADQDANNILTQGRLAQLKEVGGMGTSPNQLELADRAEQVQQFLRKIAARSGPPQPGQTLSAYLRQTLKNS